MVRFFLFLLVALIVALPCVAQAQQPDASARARAFFEAGLHQMDAHQFAEAAVAFEHSLALRESATARYNLALAYRGAHQTRNAIAALRVLLANRAQSAQAMVEDAARILAEQERALVRITLHVAGTPAEIRVDDAPAAPLVDQPVELDPGHHVFLAHAAGRAPVVVERDFPEGARGTVTIDLARGSEVPAHLEVRASVAEATIFIDGAASPTRGVYIRELPAGTHTIRVSASGYATETHDIELDPGASRVLQITLTIGGAEHHDDGGITAQWWFWTLIGVAAVAIGVTIAGVVTATSGPQFVDRPPVLGDDGRTITTLTFP